MPQSGIRELILSISLVPYYLNRKGGGGEFFY
jgi:hypothetical protein